jgi:peptidoglycan/xylan/chitin deacetylase (PgdA/CDA1 family)
MGRSRALAWLAVLVGVFLSTSPGARAQGDGNADSSEARGEAAAVIVMYHRFGEAEYPSTSIDMDQFAAHVAELTEGPYTVLPVPRIVDALLSGARLPDRTVGITIDDAYASVYERAWPILRDAALPFTLFVATDPVDRGVPGYMTWDQIRELRDAGVHIGSQAVTHPHLPTQPVARVETELAGSADRLEARLGARPTLFAYPYGETSLEIMERTAAAGYRAAFGQHSGVAQSGVQPFYLPRFPLNVSYGGIERFRQIVNALPLPVHGLSPRDPLLPYQGPGNPPAFGFSVDGSAGSLARLNCFHSDASKMTALEVLGSRVEVRFDAPFGPGRTRINCTLRADEGRYRWFGMQYFVKPN